MKKLLALLVLMLGTCSPTLAPATEDAAPTAAEVLQMMSKLPAEMCLYTGKRCEPAGFDKGPDARRIADAIAHAATGELRGTRLEDAALMATYSSYESGNDAHATGDSGRSHGAWQIKFAPAEVSEQPDRAASIWLSLARDGACKGVADDEKLAGLAGSCTSSAARQKVRQRAQLARTLTR